MLYDCVRHFCATILTCIIIPSSECLQERPQGFGSLSYYHLQFSTLVKLFKILETNLILYTKLNCWRVCVCARVRAFSYSARKVKSICSRLCMIIPRYQQEIL
jgi:hypothetical protein